MIARFSSSVIWRSQQQSQLPSGFNISGASFITWAVNLIKLFIYKQRCQNWKQYWMRKFDFVNENFNLRKGRSQTKEKKNIENNVKRKHPSIKEKATIDKI